MRHHCVCVRAHTCLSVVSVCVCPCLCVSVCGCVCVCVMYLCVCVCVFIRQCLLSVSTGVTFVFSSRLHVTLSRLFLQGEQSACWGPEVAHTQRTSLQGHQRRYTQRATPHACRDAHHTTSLALHYHAWRCNTHQVTSRDCIARGVSPWCRPAMLCD